MKLGRREKYQPIQYHWAGCLGYPVHRCHLPIDIQQIYCSAQTGQHEHLQRSCCPLWALQHICTCTCTCTSVVSYMYIFVHIKMECVDECRNSCNLSSRVLYIQICTAVFHTHLCLHIMCMYMIRHIKQGKATQHVHVLFNEDFVLWLWANSCAIIPCVVGMLVARHSLYCYVHVHVNKIKM